MQSCRYMTAPPRIEKPSYEKEYAMGFGTFCEVLDSPIQAKDAQPHSRSYLALYPTGNCQGSW